MEYITAKEAAQKWGISPRLAQQYCIDGRIAGAAKFGGTWAIPMDAQKPVDPRKKAAEQSNAPIGAVQTGSEASMPFLMGIPMPLLNTAFLPGHCMEAVNAIENEDMRTIALCEYYYFSGQSEKASDIAEQYLTSKDLSLRLSACWIYAFANLALDRIPRSKQAMQSVREFLETEEAQKNPQLKRLAVFVSTTASVLLHLPLEKEMPPLKEFISTLPPGLRLFALYIQAHYTYLQKEYGASVGIVETALALEEEIYPIPTIYLHMVATMDYMSMRQPERAKAHILEAWKLAQPDDLIEALGEHHGLLGGMLEAVIKKEWPDDFKRIIAITYKFSAGWRKIHNPHTGRSVADNLTTTEFAASMLAARDWSNKEIAAHMGISENTVKTYVATALQKLNISQRKELKQFMLR